MARYVLILVGPGGNRQCDRAVVLVPGVVLGRDGNALAGLAGREGYVQVEGGFREGNSWGVTGSSGLLGSGGG